MPTVRIYPMVSHASTAEALPQIVRFLIGDHTTYTGPGWSLIETYSSAEGRQQPSDPHNIDTIADAEWTTGPVSVGSWCVLESADANNTNHFQIYIEHDSATAWNFIMIPFADFVINGADESPPQLPTSSFGNLSGTASVMTVAATTLYTVIADEGNASIINTTLAGTFNFHFFGEVNPVIMSGSIGDTRPYIMRRTNAAMSWAAASNPNYYSRLSPFDNATVLTSSDGEVQSVSSGDAAQSLHDGLGFDVLGQTIFPVGLYFNDLNHKHFAGWFRNLYSAHADLSPKSGTISTPNSGVFLYMSNGSTPPQLCFPFGTGSFSTGTVGHFIQPNHFSNNRFDYYMVDSYSGPGDVSTVVSTTVAVLPSGSFDRNRLRINYPYRRQRPRYGNVSG